MIRWEYDWLLYTSDMDSMYKIDDAGMNGWELIGIYNRLDVNGKQHSFAVLKREYVEGRDEDV